MIRPFLPTNNQLKAKNDHKRKKCNNSKLGFMNGGEWGGSESWLVDGCHGCLILFSFVGIERSAHFSSSISSSSSSSPATDGISVVGNDVVVGVVAGATTGAAVDCAFVLKLAVFFVGPKGDVVIRRDTLRSRSMFVRKENSKKSKRESFQMSHGFEGVEINLVSKNKRTLKHNKPN